jgi:hypothetical protein
LRTVLAALAGGLLLAGCGGGIEEWRFTRDQGVRIPDAVSAEAVRHAGSILLYVNTPRGIELFRSADGLRFERVRGRLPLGAHPAVVRHPRRGLRMYYVTSGAPPVHPSELYSAYSADGVTWWLEGGKRLRDVGFGVPDVVRLHDGSVRIYFNDNRFRKRSRIVSATSRNGLAFRPDSGFRLPPPYADPAVIRLDRTHWLMAVASSIPGEEQRIYLAESSDGLRWRLRPEPLVSDEAASDFDPTFLPLGGRRYRLYYTRAEQPRAGRRVFELRSGILELG